MGHLDLVLFPMSGSLGHLDLTLSLLFFWLELGHFYLSIAQGRVLLRMSLSRTSVSGLTVTSKIFLFGHVFNFLVDSGHLVVASWLFWPFCDSCDSSFSFCARPNALEPEAPASSSSRPIVEVPVERASGLSKEVPAPQDDNVALSYSSAG